jgi:hypothetical protein
MGARSAKALRVSSSDLLTCILTRPPLGISGVVNHSQYMHQFQSNGIKDAVRETRQQRAPYTGQHFRKHQRHLFKALQLEFKGQLKFGSQPGTAFFVPVVRPTKLANRTARKLHAVCHVPSFNLALTWSHEYPASGSFSKSAKRALSSAFSCGETSMASGTAAMLSQINSTR